MRSDLQQEIGSVWLASRVVVAAAGVVACVPLVFGVVGAVGAFEGAGDLSIGWGRLARSAGVAALIATLATGLGFVLSRAVRRRVSAALVALPALVPPYLAYAGWGELRGAGTWTGDWLLAQAGEGRAWITVFVGRAFAVVGLAVWAAPIAAFVLAMARSRLGRGVEEAVSLDASGVRAGRAGLRALAPAAVLAWVCVFALMLGSAVPLHLAQLDTVSIEAWLRLSLEAPGRGGKAWLVSWPVLCVAVAVGALGWGRAVDLAEASSEPAGGTRFGFLWIGLAVGLGVAGPVLMQFLSMRELSSLVGVMGELGPRLVSSGVVAVTLGAAGAVVALAAGAVSRGALIGFVGCAALCCALVPGVLVGDAWVRAAPGWLGGSPLLLFLAHGSRFVFVPLLAGAWLGRNEPRDLARQLAMDGGGLAGWAQGVLPRQAPVAIGAGLIVGALSLHEIEASVIVAPPGRDQLARFMLDLLHYQRNETLAASVVWVAGAGSVLAVLGVWLSGWRNGRTPERNNQG